jgi:hypothetical protein
LQTAKVGGEGGYDYIWRQLAQAAKSLAFGGIDLTVRQGRRKKWQILYALQIFAWGTLWKNTTYLEGSC